MSNLKIGPVDITSGTASLSSGGLTVGGTQFSVSANGTVNLGTSYFPTTGGCVVTKGTTGDGSSIVVVSGDAGKDKGFAIYTGANSRWLMGSNVDPETGGNAGSNFCLHRYADDGSYIDTPLFMYRSIGVLNATNGLTVPTRLAGDNSNFAASTSFVRNAISTISSGVTSFNGRTGAVTLEYSDITNALGYASTNSSGAVSFTSAGTYYWTAPMGVTTILVSGCAGGGGSAITFSPHGAVQGGNGQYCYQVPLSVTPGTVYTITVGDVGATSNVITTPTSGGAGGITSFGTLLTLTGGGGGWLEGNVTHHAGASYAAMGSSPAFNDSTGAMFGQGAIPFNDGSGGWYATSGKCGFITFTW